MIYARLKGNINYFCTAMYSISINEQIVYATSNEYAAFAAYRSYCREFDNKPKTIILSDDGQRIHVKTAGQMLLEDVDKVTTNELLKIIMQQIDIDIKDIKAIVKDLDLPLSASRVGSWTLPPDNRRYTQMHKDELALLLPHLLKQNHKTAEVANLGFTADNLKQMRTKLGLTQAAAADIVGVSGGRQVRRWENAEQDMPSEKWQIFLNYYQNNQ